jgi:hypothetical protein
VRLIVGLVLVFAVHFVVEFLVYPEFVVTALGAGSAYGFLYARYLPGAENANANARVAIVAVLTLLTMALSLWGSLLLPVNVYGT